jgi:hypothetical protein
MTTTSAAASDSDDSMYINQVRQNSPWSPKKRRENPTHYRQRSRMKKNWGGSHDQHLLRTEIRLLLAFIQAR